VVVRVFVTTIDISDAPYLLVSPTPKGGFKRFRGIPTAINSLKIIARFSVIPAMKIEGA
jgi:hypothetical protein